MSTVLYVVRHAESSPSDDLPEPERPLSERGLRQAEALRELLSGLGVDAIDSSPYPRAVDTVRPFAAAHGKPIHRVDGLRERCLTTAPARRQSRRAPCLRRSRPQR